MNYLFVCSINTLSLKDIFVYIINRGTLLILIRIFMAIATLNPIFISISGRIGSFVFYKRKKTQCIRTYVVPRNPDTVSQRNIRRSFAEAVTSWQALTTEERYKHTRRAHGTNMSGYNLYISEYMKVKISTKPKPEIKSSFRDSLNPCSLQRRIHSVSASIINVFCTLTSGRELYYNNGST